MEAFALFLKGIEDESKHDYRLILIGGCRDYDDFKRVEALKETSARMGLPESQVLFEVNAPSAKVKEYLNNATINLHTMVDEHFGIGRFTDLSPTFVLFYLLNL